MIKEKAMIKVGKNDRVLVSSKKSMRKLLKKRDIVATFLLENKVTIPDPTDVLLVLSLARAYFKVDHYKEGTSVPSLQACYGNILKFIPRRLRTRKNNTVKIKFTDPSDEKVRNFYEGYQWRRARYSCLKEHGFKCLACGRSAVDGAVIHVDHKKPLRKYWHLRLDPENLQPLCDLCNHGKGNWDETDLVKHHQEVKMPHNMTYEALDNAYKLAEAENDNLRTILRKYLVHLEPEKKLELAKLMDKPIEEGGIVGDNRLDDLEQPMLDMSFLLLKCAEHLQKGVEGYNEGFEGFHESWFGIADDLANKCREYDPVKQAPTYGLAGLRDTRLLEALLKNRGEVSEP